MTAVFNYEILNDRQMSNLECWVVSSLFCIDHTLGFLEPCKGVRFWQAMAHHKIYWVEECFYLLPIDEMSRWDRFYKSTCYPLIKMRSVLSSIKDWDDWLEARIECLYGPDAHSEYQLTCYDDDMDSGATGCGPRHILTEKIEAARGRPNFASSTPADEDGIFDFASGGCFGSVENGLVFSEVHAIDYA